ncbi:bifunctional enoyl-CoA hydratase/phosphate acetyltransferase [Candidatus Fermentibacteria bacterium]|nr:bifunctional enoyl-CoA hydratase/phosphate acetyltransferase [Candidatus Fermentibacteria bacterium]
MEAVRSLAELKKMARDLPSRRVAVVRADEVETLEAVGEAVKSEMIEAILIGPVREIRECSARAGVDIGGMEIIEAPDDPTAARMGVDLVREGRADALMKGLVATSEYLHPIVDREHGIRIPGSLLSHVAVFEVPTYPKLLIVTDAAMVIAPDFDQKVEMLKNAVTVARALGIERPRSTLVCAKEVPYDKMPCTLEAARMKEMGQKGLLGETVFDGPLAMDLAVSKEAAAIKKVKSEVAGDADIILTPDIEAGNILYKTLIFLARAELGAVIMGAQCPVVLTSRADSAESKLCSLALAGVVAGHLAAEGGVR